MDAFEGTIHAKVDVKGRVFVPASFRKILQSTPESRLKLRKDIFQNCLALYPKNHWEVELNKLDDRLNDMGDDESQNTFRMISAFVETVELDSNGRLLIPKKYLNMAKISNKICFVGMNRYIEIWNPDQFAEIMMTSDDLKSNVRKFLSRSRQTNENSGQK